MTQQLLTESAEKTKQQIADRESCPDSVRSFHEGRHPILQLHRTLGNQRVAQLIQAKRLTAQGKILRLQPKLTIGAADDQCEQEADRVADEATRTPESAAFGGQQSAVSLDNAFLPMKPGSRFAKGPACGEEEVLQKRPIAIGSFVQRQVEGEEEERIQTTGEPGGAWSLILSVGSSIASLRRAGKPPGESERTFFEPGFGHVFSQVRLHTDGQVGTLAKTVHAKAFTVGHDVFFSQGEYSPGSSEGTGLFAHELTHVIQQERGPESKRHVHGSAAPRHAQDRTVPSPDVVMRKVQTSSAAVLSAFQALCPSARFTSGQGGFIAGRGCAGVNTTQTTCKCLCYAVTNRSLYSFDVSMASWSKRPKWMHDYSVTRIPIPSFRPHSGTNGSSWVIKLPSASSSGIFGAFDPGGNCMPCSFERLLAHEICGHAVAPPTGEQEYGDRPSHDLAIQFENDIAKEQGWPSRGFYSDPNQGESYSQESGDPKIVYKLKDGWYYRPCTPPPENAPGQQRPRRRRRRRKRSSMPQQKITNTENVRLVSEPVHWDEEAFIRRRLPKDTPVEFLHDGAGEKFNNTDTMYQWWYVRADGVEGWVMQVLLDDVTESP
jgi:hypothetical protein